MSWITFAYSLPKEQSSTRVTLWRRLQRLGAVAPAGNLYLLPATDDCIESFQWLTQEIQEKGGQAIMGLCEVFQGMDDDALIALFCVARGKEYEAISAEITLIESQSPQTDQELAQLAPQISKLHRQIADVGRIDYFDCEAGIQVTQRLHNLEQRLFGEGETVEVERLNKTDFQGKTWRTRHNPHVDRLSSIWLIRRFIDEDAEIRYGDGRAEDITFDMPNARFGHTGNLCTFETLMRSFGLHQNEDTDVRKVAEIVHEIDLNDGLYHHAETIGLAAVLHGWRSQELSDQELEQRGLALFDGLLNGIKKELINGSN